MSTRALLVLAAVSFLSGCEGEDCLGIWHELEPEQADMLVGDEFTARLFVESCSGAREEVAVRWSSTDTLVARVDSLSGLVTAVGAGNTEIVAIRSPGAHFGEIPVVVTSP